MYYPTCLIFLESQISQQSHSNATSFCNTTYKVVFVVSFFRIETNTWPPETNERIHYCAETIFKITFPCHLIYNIKKKAVPWANWIGITQGICSNCSSLPVLYTPPMEEEQLQRFSSGINKKGLCLGTATQNRHFPLWKWIFRIGFDECLCVCVCVCVDKRFWIAPGFPSWWETLLVVNIQYHWQHPSTPMHLCASWLSWRLKMLARWTCGRSQL